MATVQTYNYPFYSQGSLMRDQDLTAYLATPGILPGFSPLPQQDKTKSPHKFIYQSISKYRYNLPSPTINPILYKALPSKNHIRLLEILPGSNNPLQYKLHVGYLPNN